MTRIETLTSFENTEVSKIYSDIIADAIADGIQDVQAHRSAKHWVYITGDMDGEKVELILAPSGQEYEVRLHSKEIAECTIKL